MLFWVFLAVTTVLCLYAAGSSVDKKLSVGKNVKEAVKGFFAGILLCFIGSAFVFMVVSAFTSREFGDKRVTVQTDVYQVAEKSKIDTSDNRIKFTSVTDDGTLEPVSINYKIVELNSLKDGKTIKVITEDQYHTWLMPWPLNTFKKVIVE